MRGFRNLTVPKASAAGGAGTGTVTHSVGALTANQLMLGNGLADTITLAPGTAGEVLTAATPPTWKKGFPWINVKDLGAVGDGVTDDTAAFQAALDLSGVLASDTVGILVPPGDYKITNTLFAEGSSSYGLRFRGEVGSSRGGTGSCLVWFGHKGAGMFHGLGLNGFVKEHLEFRCDSSTRMKWGVWLDSTINYGASTTVNTTSLVRTSDIVTLTTAAVHGLAAGDTVRIAGATASDFNGTFHVLTVPTTSTATYIQKGANASTSAGTTTRYKSAGSSGSIFNTCVIRDTSAATIAVSTISRDGTNGTLTFATAHYATPGDKIALTGVTDSTYNGYYVVDAILNSTSLTYFDSQAAGTSSGGTIQPDSYALAIGHVGATSTQVSEITLSDVSLIGNFSTSLHAFHFFGSGNTKNPAIFRGSVNGFHIGTDWSQASGTFLVDGLIIGSNSAYDFLLGTGTLTLIGVESESVGARFVHGSTGGNPGHLNCFGCSAQLTLAADDVMIQYQGTIQLIGNTFYNLRTGSTYPKIVVTNPAFGGTDTASLVSIGNYYQNAPAGYVPVFDTSGNQVLTGAGTYANKAVSVVSFGDSGGTPSGAALVKLKNVLVVDAVIAQRNTGTRIPVSGFLRLASDDTCKIANNAGAADLNLLSKNTSDVVQVGDTAGVSFTGPIRQSTFTFATLPSPPVEGMRVPVTDSSTAVWRATIAGGGANHVLAYYNGTNWTVAA